MQFLTLLTGVSAFGLITVSEESAYNNREVGVLSTGYLTIDSGDPIDCELLSNTSITINGQLTHFDQGLFWIVGWPDLSGNWSIQGDRLLNDGHAGFIVCPEHWYGIAYAGVGTPITCDDPINVILAVTNESSSSSNNGSNYNLVSDGSEGSSSPTLGSENTYTAAISLTTDVSSTFTGATFNAETLLGTETSSLSSSFKTTTSVSNNMAAQHIEARWLAVLAAFL